MVIKRLIYVLLAAVLCSYVFANEPVGFGQVAGNLLAPVSVVASFLENASLILGVTALFASFFRYMQHRTNPLAQPLSTVVILFILGILLLCLPLIYQFTESGVHTA